MTTASETMSKLNGVATAYNAHNAKALCAYYAEDCTVHLPSGEILQGRAGIEERVNNFFAGLPDARLELVQALDAGTNTVMVEVVIHGTHLGTLRLNPTTTLPASGRQVALQSVLFLHLNDRGEIQTDRRTSDTMAWLEQLGAAPLPITEAQIDALTEKNVDSWNRHDPAAIASTFTENATSSFPGAPVAVGRDAIAAGAQGMFTAFPDLHLVINERMRQDARAVFTWTVTGTHTGPLGPIPASGKRVEMKGVNISEIDPSGLFKSNSVVYDRTSLLRQIGVISG